MKTMMKVLSFTVACAFLTAMAASAVTSPKFADSARPAVAATPTPDYAHGATALGNSAKNRIQTSAPKAPKGCCEKAMPACCQAGACK